jgi:hypothetical protein
MQPLLSFRYRTGGSGDSETLWERHEISSAVRPLDSLRIPQCRPLAAGYIHCRAGQAACSIRHWAERIPRQGMGKFALSTVSESYTPGGYTPEKLVEKPDSVSSQESAAAQGGLGNSRM